MRQSHHSSLPFATVLLVAVLLVVAPIVPAVRAQSIQVRVVVTNIDLVGDEVTLEVQAKQTGVSPTTLGSGTLDLIYDPAKLGAPNVTGSSLSPAQGYTLQINGSLTDGSTTYARFGFTGGGVGTDFGDGTGFDLPGAFTNLATWVFPIVEESGTTDLTIRTASLSIGFFENASNNPETGLIDTVPVDDITDANNVPLPVELIAFTAQRDGEAVVLAWQTASEMNNAGFEVQRREVTESPEAGWEVLAFVEGAGTTTEPRSYSYRHEDLSPGRHAFRLKQVDFDGAFDYSHEVEVVIEMAEAYLLTSPYPNPFNPEARFSLAVKHRQEVEVAVYNALGRRVRILYAGPLDAEQARSMVFEAGGLPSGLYLIRAVGQTFEATRSLMLVK